MKTVAFQAGDNFEQEWDSKHIFLKENYSPAEINEKYFRPSCLPAINVRALPTDFFETYLGKKYNEITVPAYLMSSPLNTIINFFSILREANNLPEDSGVGCGSIGTGRTPLPVAYQFLSPAYQTQISYDAFLDIFNNIAHLNLIKLLQLPPLNKGYQYFLEIETIEVPVKGITCFVYYSGFITVQPESGQFRITNIQLKDEDFLCAAYHGWRHDAEASVAIRYGDWCKMISKQYPVQRVGFLKNIYFLGTDGAYYLIQFVTLTNGTDLEIAQFKKNPYQPWMPIRFDPSQCIQNRQIK